MASAAEPKEKSRAGLRQHERSRGQENLVRRTRPRPLRLYGRGRPEFRCRDRRRGRAGRRTRRRRRRSPGTCLAHIRKVTDKPVKHVVLSHYHAVRVLGASAYASAEIIASDATRAMIAERGQQDMDSEIGRFPRLFRGKESIPA